MATYVIGDVHGECEQLQTLIEKMHLSDKDWLYIMGDVVDRGPHPIKALQFLMNIENCTCLIGNHEVMAIKCLKLLKNEITDELLRTLREEDLQYLLSWMENGAKSTIDEFRKLSRKEQDDVLEFIADFEAYEELSINGQEYILVHAGLGHNFSRSTPLEDYSLDELIWDRPDYEKMYYANKIVVTGHTPTQYIACNPKPGYIYKGNNHIAIDCCACSKEGRLAGICLETGEEFYSR